MELLPSDTFRFHLNLIALREYVGGTVRVFLNRLYAQWWRDRGQHDITQRHIYKDTQGQKQTRQNWSNRETTQSRKQETTYQVFCESVWTLSYTSLWTFQCSEITVWEQLIHNQSMRISEEHHLHPFRAGRRSPVWVSQSILFHLIKCNKWEWQHLI